MEPFWPAPDRGKAVESNLEPVNDERGPCGSARAGMVAVPVDAPALPMAVDTSSGSSEKAGENPAVKEAKVPYAPSREEYDKHCVTHYPYRA